MPATDYKESFYDNYVSTHITPNAGNISLKSIEYKFSSWNKRYSSLLPQKKDAEILDLGCGEGSFMYWLNSKGYNNVSGIDISQEQIGLGTSLGIKNLQCLSLFDFLGESESKFDFIIARDILEHFTKQEVLSILELINKALKPGGRVMIQVPNGMGIFYTEIFYGDFTHELAFTSTSFGQILRNTGFSSYKCFPVGPVVINFGTFIRKQCWNIIVAIIKLIKKIETGYGDGIFTRNLICLATK